jgi:hypothetical protein
MRSLRTLWLLSIFVIFHAFASASISVTVSPQFPQVKPGGQVQLSATVTGTTNSVVIWSLAGTGCSGIACGQITSGGLYLAPPSAPNPPIVTAIATSLADLSQSGSSSIFIGSSFTVGVTVSPSTARLVVGDKQRFTATVTGTANTNVGWSVSGTGCSGSDCGTITTTGLYLAPSKVPNPAQVIVTATANADNTKSSSATVTIAPPVAVSVSPQSARVVIGMKQQFKALVTGTTDTTVTWSVSGAGCSGSSCGTINSGGLYTAPSSVPSPAAVSITATSEADPTKSSTVTATIVLPVKVTITPTTAQVVAGKQQQFNATVSNTSNTAVTWSVSGAGCAGSACGTISTNGLYTAPASVPSPAQVTVTATSSADTSKSASATVTVLPPVIVTVAPATAQVVTGKQQQFTATVVNTTNPAVTWSVSGSGCSGSTCGAVSSSGLYTAPSAVPTPAQVKVKATSVADPTKSSSATVTVIPPVAVTITPTTAQVVAGKQHQYTATVTGTTNTAVTWQLSGAGCSGTACGTITTAGLYTAPAVVPSPALVQLKATSVADPTKSATATATVVEGVAVNITPTSAQVVTGAQQQFTVSVTGTTTTSVTWSVAGAGCSASACGTITSTGLYTAPNTIPKPAQVIVTATSTADSSKAASATVTIVPPIVVAISPKTAQVVAGDTEQFTALVSGTSNTAVTWSVTGTGCNGNGCGSISSSGLYTAPEVVPNPALVTVKVTSSADSTKSASATVTIVPSVVVTVSPLSVQVMAGSKQQFTAAVTGTTNTSVTWSISGSGCSGSACGSITSSGLYTAPNTIPQPAAVTIEATSSADSTKSGTATATIIQKTVVAVTPTVAIVPVKGQQQFRATVSGNLNTAVTWTVSGAGCSGTGCGAISTGGLYTAPASIPSPAEVMITAASQANPSQKATATVTIVASNNAKLVGPYAFLFKGFDAKGVYQQAGSFVADGAGHLTGGIEDVNDTDGVSKNVTFGGTYQVTADSRAAFTIKSTLGTFTFKLALSQLGDRGRFIEFDDSGIRGSGILERQDTSAFKTSAFSGGYALSLSGEDVSDTRIGAIGVIYPSGSGFISGGSLDVNDGGVLSPTFGSFNGTLTVASTGRGLTTLNIPGFDGGTFNFAFYVVSRSEFLMVSLDQLSADNPVLSGSAELQSGSPFLTSSFSGPAVFDLNGIKRTSTDCTIGRIEFENGQTIAVNYDQNNGGLITIGAKYTGAYDIQLNGRGTLNLDNESTGKTATWYFYAIAPNRAFLMDASTTAVAIGEMRSQTVVAKYSNLNLLGNYWFGSGEPVVATAPLMSGVADFDGKTNSSGEGMVNGEQDTSSSSSLSPDQTLTATYALANSSNKGRGTLAVTSPAPASMVIWMVSPTEVLGLDVDASTTQSTVVHFEQ